MATTAEVLATLGAVGVVTNVSGLRDRAASFLVGSINADGGFPGLRGAVGPDDDRAGGDRTARDRVDVSAVRASREYLRGTQLADGSWEDDPYATALAARVLDEARPDLSLESLTLSSGAVQQGTPVTSTRRTPSRSRARGTTSSAAGGTSRS